MTEMILTLDFLYFQRCAPYFFIMKILLVRKLINSMKFTSLILCLVGILFFIGCATTNREGKVLSSATAFQDKFAKNDGMLSAFRLGSGDEIKISVWRHESLNKTFVVPPGGWVSFPLAGDVQVIGLTSIELRDRISTGIEKYFSDPQVTVEIAAFRSKRVYVLGEINRPGVLYLSSPLSVVEAISLAGGFTFDAKEKTVLLIREKEENVQEVYSLDLKAAISKGKAEANPLLEPGDIVYVPTILIANISRFMRHINTIISPIVEAERAIIFGPDAIDVLKGERPKRTVVIEP